MKISEAKKYGAHPDILEKLVGGGIEHFTKVQQSAIESGLCQNKNLFISAPTSSGKTTIAELAAATGALNGKKTVYLVTHKALAEEKYAYFKSAYESPGEEWFSVSIATGDRTEGEWAEGILVATYEKFLAILGGRTKLSLESNIVVADEIQIVGDESRGSDTEILCTIIKNSNPYQFIALSAAVPNARDIADWLACDLVLVTYRDVPLRQEIRFKGKCIYNYFGDGEIFEQESKIGNSTIDVVNQVLFEKKAPVLVFTMTKRQAVELSEEFSKSKQQDTKCLELVEQLDLFSEPTTQSTRLKTIIERRVAFHSADLSYLEREAVESALRNEEIDVIFSTSTLAYGVNFPVRTVIFDSFNRSWLLDPWLPKGDYTNMAGRAGRLGFHEEGTSILIAHNRAEFIRAKEYLEPDQTPVNSRLVERSIRKPILSLISSGICNDMQQLQTFFESTFWWQQMLDYNQEKLKEMPGVINEAIDWLHANNLIQILKEKIVCTRLGTAVASTGLLPSTGVFLLECIQNNISRISADFKETILPLLHAICSSDEFSDEIGQRYLPYGGRDNQPLEIAWNQVKACSPFVNPESVSNVDRTTNAAYGLSLWVEGITEHKLSKVMPTISYGLFHKLSEDVSWVMEGLSTILQVPDIEIDSSIVTQLDIFSERVKHGVPEEILDIVRVAHKFRVPGFGRQRAMILNEYKLAEPNILLSTPIKDLSNLLEIEERAKRLVSAISEYFGESFEYWKNKHENESQELGNEIQELITRSYSSMGHEYEDIIEEIFKVMGLSISKLDEGKKQGYPDFRISHSNKTIIAECKTKDTKQATISKEAAFDVLLKAVDFECDHKLTIGKPDFGTFVKSKAAAAKDITLLSHKNLISVMLLYCKEKVSADDIFEWLLIPGVARLSKLQYE